MYGRNMFLDVPIIADLIAVCKRKQLLIDQNLMRHNKKQYDYHFKVGQFVMLIRKNWDKYKMKPRLKGLYLIEEARTNGTVSLRMSPDCVQTVHIRKLRPYRGPAIHHLPGILERQQRERELRRIAEQQRIFLPVTQLPLPRPTTVGMLPQ